MPTTAPTQRHTRHPQTLRQAAGHPRDLSPTINLSAGQQGHENEAEGIREAFRFSHAYLCGGATGNASPLGDQSTLVLKYIGERFSGPKLSGRLGKRSPPLGRASLPLNERIRRQHPFLHASEGDHTV